MTPDQWTAFLSGVVVIAATMLGGWLKFRPRWKAFWRKVDAGLTSVAGHPEIRDPANPTKVIAPARPGLGVWMANTDEHVSRLTEAVTALAQTHRRLEDHERIFTSHDARLTKLETASVERIVSRADSAAAFRAIEAVAQGNGDDLDGK